MEQIHIDWDGPMSVAEASELRGSADYGVYQLCGLHQAHRTRMLLYIGRAMGVTFGARIRSHNFDGWAGSSADIFVGRLCGRERPDDQTWGMQIKRAERLLIFTHAPPWNSSGIDNYGDVGNLQILNWGNREQLLAEVSTARWSAVDGKKPSDFRVHE